jgi:ribose transport system permease protein
VKNILKRYGIYGVFIVMVLFFSLTSKSFFSPLNLINVGRQVSMLGIAAVGMTFVLLLGGIDLSVGSQITFVNVIGALLMAKLGIDPAIASILVIIMATMVGAFNGLVVSKIKMPPLIVTMATMSILEGLAFIISGGLPIFGFPESFSILGQGYMGPVPIPVVIMVIIFATGSFVLNHTYFGRYFYAVGGNEEAALFSGINVDRVKILAYTLAGLFAGIAGIVMLSRTNSGQPLAGKGFEFQVLTAVVLGGVSVTGGSGRISNVVAGVLIIGVLNNGLLLMKVDSYAQMVAMGVVLLLAVGIDCLQKTAKGKKGKIISTGAQQTPTP